MDGEDSDGMIAYIQAELKNVSRFLGKGCQFVDTWVTLPRHLVPTEFQHLDSLVCPLRRNLYGHKLAGLLWQKFAEDVIMNELKFKRVQGWECLYYHPVKQLFLSAYVDELKMAGKRRTSLQCGS